MTENTFKKGNQSISNYYFTDETKIVSGRLLRRIAASAEHPFLPPRTLGGWIEGFHNLALSGNAWIFDESCVFGSARVYENARLYDRSQAYGNCRIYGNARLLDEAKVFDHAEIFDRAMVADSASVSGFAKAFGKCFLLEKARLQGDAQLHGDENDDDYVTLSLDSVVHGGDWTVSPYARGGQVWNCNVSSPSTFRLGCEDHTFERWHKSWPAIMRKDVWAGFERSQYLWTECLDFFNEACITAGFPQYRLNYEQVCDIITKRALHKV